MNKKQLDLIMESLPSGSGFDYDWFYHFQKNDKIRFETYHTIYKNGYRYGCFPVKIVINPSEKLEDFKLMKSYIPDNHKEYIEDTLVYTFSQIEDDYKKLSSTEN